MNLELCTGFDSNPTKPRLIPASASFYRPFLDGGYKQLITSMMDAGCFDELVEKSISVTLLKGNEFGLTDSKYPTCFTGSPNLQYRGGLQTVYEVPENANLDIQGHSAELMKQFLGTPTKIRLTTLPTRQFVDIYFP